VRALAGVANGLGRDPEDLCPDGHTWCPLPPPRASTPLVTCQAVSADSAPFEQHAALRHRRMLSRYQLIGSKVHCCFMSAFVPTPRQSRMYASPPVVAPTRH
jgi:hypothetical protein